MVNLLLRWALEMNDDQTEFNLEFTYSQPNKNGAFRNVRHRQPVTSTRRESVLSEGARPVVRCMLQVGPCIMGAGGSESVQRVDVRHLLLLYPNAMHSATDTYGVLPFACPPQPINQSHVNSLSSALNRSTS